MTRQSGLKSWTSGGAWALAALTGTAALCGTVMVSTSSETLLRNSFSTALGGNSEIQPRLAKVAPVAGSEDYWLSAMRQDGGSLLTKAVSVGDHISLSLGGREQNLEVAAVSAFSPNVTEIDTTPGPSRYVLVTARDAANAEAHPVRFVMEIADPASSVTVTKSARAL